MFFCIFLMSNARSSHPEVFCKKDVLRNFAKITGKHWCQDLFLTKLQVWGCKIIKKETLAQVLFCQFYEITKSTFSYRTSSVAAFVMQTFAKAIRPNFNLVTNIENGLNAWIRTVTINWPVKAKFLFEAMCVTWIYFLFYSELVWSKKIK